MDVVKKMCQTACMAAKAILFEIEKVTAILEHSYTLFHYPLKNMDHAECG